ncbi:3-carboxy-cis,cis-muconate cycloisomerase [Pseudorhodoferax aquiterrae]|uniref:3-carboxy-cis,cis-muconate cycloisomerase n=1 Tax=Pseudorhodoferax aquiterrae TaxID=747304 RepID=A0ABQ3FYM6_9BURK|nr:lyase family protein [Pseudorhodoferax aquiterrae]GHC74366.1 3-carboxy-cis,cis-muconate cycloisomerase [Pseudorhodoferax aquiterrae]
MSLFEGYLSTPEAVAAFSGPAVVAAMLRFEAALAQAQAEEGLVPPAAARSIVDSCRVELFDVEKIVRDSGRAGSVAIPLIKALREAVGLFNAEAVAWTHFGSTSQDVIDTALVLVTRDALDLLDADLRRCIASLLALAEAHADTPMLARTLMQPASVTSLGFKCADWAAPLVRGQKRLQQAAADALQLQLGGGVGTLAQMGVDAPRAAAVRARVAASLGLRDGGGAWHTQRDDWVALGCALALLTGSLGKLAADLALLGQHEVGELMEPAETGRGVSTVMPHKRNPVASMVALSAAQRAPQRVAALLAGMVQQHERALGPWQAEQAEWLSLWLAALGSLRALATALPGLRVDAARMQANIDRVCAELPAETVREWFAPALVAMAGDQARQRTVALRRVAG